MSDRLPIFIDFKDRKVVVIGGGSVGERKAVYFKSGDVTVVSPEFTHALEDMGRDGSVKLHRMAAKPEDLHGLIEGAFLVVAATGDPLLNEAIVCEATACGVLANSATCDAPVIVPSVVRKSGVELAISTGGRSPAMAKFLRKWLEAALGEDIERMLVLQERVRGDLKASVPEQRRREAVIQRILEDPDIWDTLEVSPDVAYEMAMRHVSAEKR
ncbi:MAG TPA: bifunctional precorrin-2 dehydrogenase/sirohydrochlorin ferrochelatase [Methanocellaceae archaeon]